MKWIVIGWHWSFSKSYSRQRCHLFTFTTITPSPLSTIAMFAPRLSRFFTTMILWKFENAIPEKNSKFRVLPFPIWVARWFSFYFQPAFYCETNKQILGSQSPPGSAHGFGWRSVFVGTDFFKARFFSVQRASFAFLIWFLSNLKNMEENSRMILKNRIITSKIPSSVCT